jgi:hypothetical protein
MLDQAKVYHAQEGCWQFQTNVGHLLGVRKVGRVWQGIRLYIVSTSVQMSCTG